MTDEKEIWDYLKANPGASTLTLSNLLGTHATHVGKLLLDMYRTGRLERKAVIVPCSTRDGARMMGIRHFEYTAVGDKYAPAVYRAVPKPKHKKTKSTPIQAKPVAPVVAGLDLDSMTLGQLRALRAKIDALFARP